MTGNNKVLSAATVLLLLLIMIWIGKSPDAAMEITGMEEAETIYIWYADEVMTDYINSAALAFYEETGTRVVPVLHSGSAYLEDINATSLSGNEVPDLYIVGADSIEKAVMAGLAIPVLDTQQILSAMNYPEVALNAVTYKTEIFGYPFYYETAFLLYNETYLNEIADSALRQEIEEAQSGEGQEEGMDSGMEDVEEAVSENTAPPQPYTEEEWNYMVAEKSLALIPDSIEDILGFANEYSAPQSVENIFLWDVSDIFYNYFFTGAYMNVGGIYGDDSAVVEIYNEDTIRCMQVYQELNQFFSIDSKESSYETVMQSFLEGKTIFTIATTDILSVLETARADGSFPYDYGIAALPGVDDGHVAQGLSTTNAVLINGYTDQREEADAFAAYLTGTCAGTLYARTGKLPAAFPPEDYNMVDVTDVVMQFYRQSVSLPKILEISNFWIQLELAYTLIWDGADPNETLRLLSEQMKTQIAGEPVTQDAIILPEPVTEEENVSDE